VAAIAFIITPIVAQRPLQVGQWRSVAAITFIITAIVAQIAAKKRCNSEALKFHKSPSLPCLFLSDSLSLCLVSPFTCSKEKKKKIGGETMKDLPLQHLSTLNYQPPDNIKIVASEYYLWHSPK